MTGLLLELGADPNVVSPVWGTPLCYAVTREQAEIVELLLKAEAKTGPEAFDAMIVEIGLGAYDEAARSRVREVLHRLAFGSGDT